MVRYLIASIVLLLAGFFLRPTNGFAQPISHPDTLASLMHEFSRPAEGRNPYLVGLRLVSYYKKHNLDSANMYVDSMFERVRANRSEQGLALAQYAKGIVLISEAEPDSAIGILEAAEAKFEQLGDSQFVAEVLLAQSIAYSELGDFESASEAYAATYSAYEELGDEVGMLTVLNSWGTVHLQIGDLQGALDLLLKAFARLDTAQHSTASAIHSNLALVYDYLGDYDKALHHNWRALEVYTQTGDLSGMHLASNQISVVYSFTGQLDSSIFWAQKALEIAERLNDRVALAVCYGNLGSILRSKGDLQGALRALEASLKIDRELGNVDGILYSLASVVRIHRALNNKSKALAGLKEGTELLAGARDLITARDWNALAYETYKTSGEPGAALEAYERFVTLRDSLVNEEDRAAVAAREVRLEYMLKAAADSVQQLEKEKLDEARLQAERARTEQQEQRTVLLGVILSLALALVAFVYVRYRNAARQRAELAGQKQQIEATNAQLDARNAEKELLLKEIHHRVKNNLQIISSLLELQSKGIEDQSAISAVADGQSRVKSMALIHQKLYQTEHIAAVDFGEYASQLFQQLAAMYPEAKAGCEVVSNNIELDIDTAIPVALILNELITNAFKYAFDKQGSNQLNVHLVRQAEGSYSLTVSDSGKGLPAAFDFDRTRSLGLRLVRRLSRQLYGTATYHFQEGAIFTITFKDTEARKQIA